MQTHFIMAVSIIMISMGFARAGNDTVITQPNSIVGLQLRLSDVETALVKRQQPSKVKIFSGIIMIAAGITAGTIIIYKQNHTKNSWFFKTTLEQNNFYICISIGMIAAGVSMIFQ